MKRSFVLTVLIAFVSISAAQKPVTLKTGSSERKAIMDALRVPVQKEIGGKIIFEVRHLKSNATWAYLEGSPRRPGGKKIDYSKTKFRQMLADGVFGDSVLALLKRAGGKWKVVELALGPTDYPTEFWRTKHKDLPVGLFPH